MILKDLQTAYFLMNIDVSFKKCLQRKDFAETKNKNPKPIKPLDIRIRNLTK